MTSSEELEVLAREIHAAWRDGMLAQGREVAPHRMMWDTLSPDDHVLDAYIAERVTRALYTRISELEARVQAAEARAEAAEGEVESLKAELATCTQFESPMYRMDIDLDAIKQGRAERRTKRAEALAQAGAGGEGL